MGIFSIGIANILVLFQVVMLWDRNIVRQEAPFENPQGVTESLQTVVTILSIGFIASFCTTFSLMVVAAVRLVGEHSVYTNTIATLIGIHVSNR